MVKERWEKCQNKVKLNKSKKWRPAKREYDESFRLESNQHSLLFLAIYVMESSGEGVGP